MVIWEVSLEEKEDELDWSRETIHKLKCIVSIYEYIHQWTEFIKLENAEEISIDKLREIAFV